MDGRSRVPRAPFDALRTPALSLPKVRAVALVLSALAVAQAALAASCGPPPKAKPQRRTGGESFPPLPLPATPLRRSEKKREPAPPALVCDACCGRKSFDLAFRGEIARVLPEAKLDRFMFRVQVGYPSFEEKREIVRSTTYDAGVKLEPVLGESEVLGLQSVVRKVPVTDHVVDYALRLVRATRPAEEGAPGFIREWLSWGAGPRAAQYLVLAAKARAVLSGRYAATCDDIRWAAQPVLGHRISTNFTADSEGVSPSQVVERLLAEVKEPSEADYLARAPVARGARK